MLKKIALGIGIGSQVIANAAVLNESSDLGVWSWQVPSSPVVTKCLVTVTQPLLTAKGFHLKMEQVEVVRCVDVTIHSLPEILELPGFLAIDLDTKVLDSLIPQMAALDKIDRFLPKVTFAFAGEPAMCPDRPVIPDWAWAWELSSSDGW
ncbi:MAG: hypothetical protein K1X67_02305 [Fimbriimonadaceae bacterium]|nr:hypothetical protein [Fimbriimonadaceae bacterium]